MGFSFFLIFFTLFSTLSFSSEVNELLIERGIDFNDCLDQIQKMEKSELHLHIGGAWPIDYLEKIAAPQDFAQLSIMLANIQDGVDYHDAFKVFGLISKIVNSDEKIENGVVAICMDLLQDNVTYAELRTGLKDLGSGLEGYLKTVLRGIERGIQGTRLKAGLILSLRRDTNAFIAAQTIDLAMKYRNKGVIGIDLSGDSTQGDSALILPYLLKAKENGLPITLHIGESEEETRQQQILELFTIQPQRIGHGVHLCDEAKEWVEKNKILVELCLTSALKAGMINSAKEHPALKLLLKKHPVSISTDDPLIFKTTLSQEYAQVALVTGLKPEEIAELQKQNHHYKFLCHEDQQDF